MRQRKSVLVLILWEDGEHRGSFCLEESESLGVSGLSSSGTGFNQSGLVLIFKRWATSVSSESERCTSSGIRSSL
ncbi:hypothetical protein Tco_1406626 [Tanacetum coccineum]